MDHIPPCCMSTITFWCPSRPPFVPASTFRCPRAHHPHSLSFLPLQTSCKDAIKNWEAKAGEGKKVADETTIKLCFQMPPIGKMDAGLKELAHVEFLSLSTNCIEKIANLNGFKNLKILSLGRNNIKGLAGLEQVADTLEQLWVSYCPIEKLKGVSVLKNVKTLYVATGAVASLYALLRNNCTARPASSRTILTHHREPLGVRSGGRRRLQSLRLLTRALACR